MATGSRICTDCKIPQVVDFFLHLIQVGFVGVNNVQDPEKKKASLPHVTSYTDEKIGYCDMEKKRNNTELQLTSRVDDNGNDKKH